MHSSSVFYGLMIFLTSLLLFPSALSQDLALVHTQEDGAASVVTSADAEPPEVSSDQVTILTSDWLILVT